MRSREEIKAVGELLAQGRSLESVSRELHVPLTTVHRWKNKMEENGSLKKEEFADLLWENACLAGQIIKRGLSNMADSSEPVKIEDMQKLSTVMGTNYDKHALATGGVTNRIGLSFEEMPEMPTNDNADD